MAFGDVTVEDSRNLTTNNARKIIRLAQCQVEYLLHVQETLVHHKERLRRVAEAAQRDAIDAKSKTRDERAKARATRAELRRAKKALKTYEVLEQIRGGKPLDEILTGAVLVAGPGPAPAGADADASTRASRAETASRLTALARGAAGGDAGVGSPGASPDVLAAKAAARAVEAMRAEDDLERRLASATRAANDLRAEKASLEAARDEAIAALDEANASAERRLASQEERFETAISEMETRLETAKREAEETRRAADAEATAAREARDAAAEADERARRVEMETLRASVQSVGDGVVVEAAAATYRAEAAERRLADLEARDSAIIDELRDRLAEKDAEVSALRRKREDLESQLVKIAANASMTPSELLTPGAGPTPHLSPARSLRRESGGDASGVSLARRSGELFAEELRASLAGAASTEGDSERLREAREEMARAKKAAEDARAAKEKVECERLEAAAREAEAAREEVARLKREREEEISRLKRQREEEVARVAAERDAEKTAKEAEIARLKTEREQELEALAREREAEAERQRAERDAELERIRERGSREVETLRETNAALTAEAEKRRAEAEAAKRAELEARERALRDAEAREEKVRAAAATLERERAERALDEERLAALRKSSPERKAASDAVAAELKMMRETANAETIAEGTIAEGGTTGSGWSSARSEISEVSSAEALSSAGAPPGDATRDFSLAPSTAVTASVEPESRVQEGAGEAAEPTVASKPIEIESGEAEEEKEKNEEEQERTKVEEEEEEKESRDEEEKTKDEACVPVKDDDDDMEGEMIVHDDVPDEEAQPPVVSSPAAARAQAEARETKAAEEAEEAGDTTVATAAEETEAATAAEETEAATAAEETEAATAAEDTIATKDVSSPDPPTPPSVSPPPLPVIPLVRTLSGVSDEPEPISPRTADSIIGAQAARLADATNDARASELRLLIEQSETASRPLPPGSDARLLAAHERDLASRSEAATKARAELEEIERASRETAAEAARAVAKAVTAVRPLTKEEKEAWLAKHPYQPVPRAPFALSRFSSHDPELFDAAEEAVVAYLEERVMEQLSDQGVPEDAVGLDDVKYVRMMAKFREERRAQVEDLGEEEKRRYELERAAILNHIAATSRAIMAGYKTPAEAEAGGFSVTKTLFATPGAAVTGASIAAAVPKVMEGASPRDSLDSAAVSEAMRNDPNVSLSTDVTGSMSLSATSTPGI